MSEVKDHVVIPVKPALVTAANGAALTAAAVASAGAVAGVAIVGGVVATGAAIKGARKAKKAVSTHRASTAARKAGASTGAMAKRAAGKSGTSAGRPSGGKAAAGRGLLARMAGKKAAATSGKGPSSKGASAGGTSGRKGGSGKVSPLASLARSKRAGASGPKSAGGSRSHLTRAGKWAGKKASAATRRAVGLPADGPKKKGDIRRAGFKKARGWFQSNIMGKKPATKKKVASNAAEKNIKPTVKRGAVNASVAPGFIGPLAPGAIIPGQLPEYLTSNAPTPAIATPHGGAMKQHAQHMANDAHDYDAPGILAIIDYMDENLHDSLRLVAEAFDALSQKARNKWPFDQAIGQKLSMTSECLWTAASMSRDIVPDIEAIHAEELRKLRNPDRPGMEKFDLAANGKA